ncbi:hypothetical protein BKA62DRAFT_644217 [Auriculariales sp. MPI-PUGE-AT-0066]|nr:hypothetical protein BKA62DRAFT_644217 [Auriculariales sp. MPI-PUGE-AT-0066]
MSGAKASETVANQLQKYHPLFTEAGDVTLLTSDNVLFNIETRDLQRTSSWFRDLFKNSHPSVEGQTETIGVSEKSETLEIILKMALGLVPPTQPMTSVDALDTALRAAEKYEMTGVTHHLISVLERLLLRSSDSLQQYILSCRYGMTTLRNESLVRCSGVRLSWDDLPPLEVKDLGRLLAEREKRTRYIQQVLRSTKQNESPFYKQNSGFCPECAGERDLHATYLRKWQDFIAAALCVISFAPNVDAIFTDSEAASKEAFGDLRAKLQGKMNAFDKS